MSTMTQRAVVELPTDNQILITRHIAAPREQVYRAWTTPELVRRWWHANRGEMTVCEIDLRVGGEWRYVMTAHGGFSVGFHGEYREIEPDARLVSTEVFEGMPDAPALSTVTFADDDAGTRVRILVEHTCKAHRDAHIESGMEAGLQEALGLLESVASE